MSAAHARPELLASVDWLAENLGRPELRVLDVRWRPDDSGRKVFASGHVPSATWLDWRATLTAPVPGDQGISLAPPDRIGEALSAAGVGNGSTVVVYDDLASLYASRAWWSLRACGLDSVRILDGGFAAWEASGRPVSHAVAEPRGERFLARAAVQVRLTTADVRALVGSPEALFVDARAQVEFRGLQGSGPRLGRLPGAVNLPAGLLTEPGTGRFVDGAALRALFTRSGIERGKRLVCYDTVGVGAAKVAFALALMGHENVAVYDGGWAEWSARPDLPLEPDGCPALTLAER
jgi:thiosulfate/3-mercaptopyruvate sulfurtransferase